MELINEGEEEEGGKKEEDNKRVKGERVTEMGGDEEEKRGEK